MSRTDGIVRVTVAIVIAALYFTGTISGTVAGVLGVIGLIFIITGFINFCPLYAALKIRTRAKS